MTLYYNDKQLAVKRNIIKIVVDKCLAVIHYSFAPPNNRRLK